MLKLLAISLSISLALGATGGINLSFTVVSDSNTRVSGPDVTGVVAAVPTWVHPAWTAKIPGATWIWDAPKVTAPTTQQVCQFSNKFYIAGNPVSVILDLAADNGVSTFVNGKDARCTNGGNSFQSETQLKCDITSFVSKGLNSIKFSVTNAPGGSTYDANPGGLLYRVSVKYFRPSQ